MRMPEQARPHEVAILRVYLLESSDPKEIATILHYRSPQPVYRVIKRHRDFLAAQRTALYGLTIVL